MSKRRPSTRGLASRLARHRCSRHRHPSLSSTRAPTKPRYPPAALELLPAIQPLARTSSASALLLPPLATSAAALVSRSIESWRRPVSDGDLARRGGAAARCLASSAPAASSSAAHSGSASGPLASHDWAASAPLTSADGNGGSAATGGVRRLLVQVSRIVRHGSIAGSRHSKAPHVCCVL